MNYTIVIGTNRPNSKSAIIGGIYEKMLKERGITPCIINLDELPHDFLFSNMYGKKNEDFAAIQENVFETDKFFFIIPEYNGSFPGVLKAFIDGCKFPESFSGKKCCLTGLSEGQFGNVRGLEHFTGIANYIKMDVFHVKLYFMGIERRL